MLTTAWVVTIIVGLLSIQPAANMLSPTQIMNTSYDPFDLVNTYGAFGTVDHERMNVVFEGTLHGNHISIKVCLCFLTNSHRK